MSRTLRKGGRVHTRKALKSRAKSYRRHRKESKCAGKGPAACRGAKACKLASGRKRSFCRTARNTHTRRHRK